MPDLGVILCPGCKDVLPEAALIGDADHQHPPAARRRLGAGGQLREAVHATPTRAIRQVDAVQELLVELPRLAWERDGRVLGLKVHCLERD